MAAETEHRFPLYAGGGSALLAAGALVIAVAPADSWPLLAGLFVTLAGLLALYTAIHLRMQQYLRRQPAAGVAQEQRHSGGIGIASLRVVLILAVLGSAGAWLWSAGVDLAEVGLLVFNGKTAPATVIGRDIVAKDALVGSVNYSYRVSPTLAVVDHFAIPRSAYRAYWTGYPIDITYARSLPRVHRVGVVNLLYGIRRLLYWLLLLGNGAAVVLLPLWLLEFRRRPSARRVSIANVRAAG